MAATLSPCPVGQTPLSQNGMPQILMSPPDFFTVNYAINPWMTADGLDVELAKTQWQNLKKAITEVAGANVHTLPAVEGLPDLVFTANAAFIYQNKAVPARYKYPERQGEEPYNITWLKEKGFEVTVLADDMPFEGAGDALIYEGTILAAYGTRSDKRSHTILAEVSGLPVVSLELTDPRFYHIDVCLCPIGNGYLIYTPDAFTDEGRKALEALVPAEKRIPVCVEEANRFACNAVSINQFVIFNEGSPQLAADLTERGFSPIQVNLSEFIKAGGSAKCLTLRVG